MKVKDWVTDKVLTIHPHTSAKEAFGMMKSLGIRHLVVTDGDDVLGIVTDRDLRRPRISDVFKSWDTLYRLSDQFQVEDLMSAPVTTVKESASITSAARLLVKKRISALPVITAKGKLRGILTDTDVLRAFISGKK